MMNGLFRVVRESQVTIVMRASGCNAADVHSGSIVAALEPRTSRRGKSIFSVYVDHKL